MKFNELLQGLLTHIKELIESPEFLEEFRTPRRFVKKAMLTLSKMVTFLLFHSKKALDGKVAEFKDNFPDVSFPSVSKQAISKARYGIGFELFREFFHCTSWYYYRNVGNRKKWKKQYYIFAIDGSQLEIPTSKSTFEDFGKKTDPKNPEYSWAMGSASVLLDVLEDIIVDAALEKLNTSEREMANRHLSRLHELGIAKDAIVVFDRGYYSADIYQECINTGCKCLMRLKSTSNLCRLAGSDELTVVKAPDGTPMECRVLKVTLKTGETEYLITNVLDYWIAPNCFRDLYFERWKIESKYLELKEQWKIEEFTGTGTLAVLQDFYISMLHANLASIAKNGADEVIQTTSGSKNLYRYKARRSFLIGRIQRLFVKWLLVSPTQKDIDELIREASRKKSQVQPDRSSERKRHVREKKHYKNRKAVF